MGEPSFLDRIFEMERRLNELEANIGWGTRPHGSTHVDGGSDEFSVAGLSGVLADAQNADKLQGRAVSAAAPADANVLTWVAASTNWAPAAPSTPTVPYDLSYYRRTGATANRYYTMPMTATNLSATATPAANSLNAHPLVVARGVTLDTIAIKVTTAAGTLARLGIYNDDGNLYPSSLVLDAGTVSTTTTGVKTITISQSLAKGLYWLAILANGAVYITAVAQADIIPILGVESGLYGPGTEYYIAYTYGALPTTFPASATLYYGNTGAIFVRISAYT